MVKNVIEFFIKILFLMHIYFSFLKILNQSYSLIIYFVKVIVPVDKSSVLQVARHHSLTKREKLDTENGY